MKCLALALLVVAAQAHAGPITIWSGSCFQFAEIVGNNVVAVGQPNCPPALPKRAATAARPASVPQTYLDFLPDATKPAPVKK